MNQAVLNRARSDKFRLVLDLPIVLKSQMDVILEAYPDPDKIQFTCFGSPTPTISIPSIDLGFSGQHYKASSHSRPPYPPLTIKLLIDNGYQNWWILWKWLNLYNDTATSISPANNAVIPPIVGESSQIYNPLTDFTTTFSIYSTDEMNRNIMAFTYKGARVTQLSEIQFNYQDPSEIICQATFEYHQFMANLTTNVNQC